MNTGFGAALGAAANVIVFGAIIWGLMRTVAHRRRILLAVGIPVAFNVALLLFKVSLTMEQRVWGAVATLLVSTAAMVWLLRQPVRTP
jgi:hypothetical protein